jgi:hypothetical protein
MIEALHIRHLSGKTEEAYVRAVARFAEVTGCSPAKAGSEEVTRDLLDLRDVEQV